MSESKRPAAGGGAGNFVEKLEPRALLHAAAVAASDFASFAMHVQFAPASVTPVDGYVIDCGLPLTDGAEGPGFGWIVKKTAHPVVRSPKLAAPDARYSSFAKLKSGATWEVMLPNGTYQVHIVAGDPKARSGKFAFDAEQVELLRGEITSDQRWVEATQTVTVTDGSLELITPAGFRTNKVNFLDITPVLDSPTPTPTPTPTPIPTPTPTPVPGLTTVGDWQTGAPSPVDRAEALGAAVNGKLYVFGGLHGPGHGFSFAATTRSDVYDPATDTWTRLPDMPEAFTHTTVAVGGPTIWFVGGFLGNSPGPGSAHVWKFNTISSTWSRGPDLPEPRGSGGSGFVGRVLHFFGGADENRIDRTDHWAYDLDHFDLGWQRKADLPTTRNHLSSAVVGGKIYAIGGQRGDLTAGVDLDEVSVYDPAADAWAALAPLPSPRSHTNCCTLVLNYKILVLGGESPDLHQEIEQYDPATNTWLLFGLMPDPRSTAVAGIIDGKVVLATGNAPGSTMDVWIGTLS
jgi:hypothetical protein